jgi:hypothetical protein
MTAKQEHESWSRWHHWCHFLIPVVPKQAVKASFLAPESDLIPVVPLLAPVVPQVNSGAKRSLFEPVQIKRNFPALNPYSALVFGGE